MSKIPKLNIFQIPLDDIKLATNNFADSNLLGDGGFGRVYKGQLPVSTFSGEPAGTIVAVKRLDVKNGQELETALELQTDIRKTMLWGSNTGGSPWWFRLESNQKLKKIFIDHERWIYSIAFTTQDLDDSVHYFQQHGGHNGPSGYTISQIDLETDEEITGIQGTIIRVPVMPSGSLTVLSSLCLLTNKKKYGPFGDHEDETRFSETWDVGSFRGFYGRAGNYLDGLGCILKAIP